jgi:hypothetical protein
MEEEIERYRAGLFQALELTEAIPWEPYLDSFAARETALQSTSVVTQGSPCPTNAMIHENKAEKIMHPRRPLNLNVEQRCVAVINQMALTQTPIELSEDESDLASRLIAAVNVTAEDFNGDGLFVRPKDSVSVCMDEDRAVFAVSTEDRGPIITKEILAKRWGIGLNTAHRALTAMTQVGIQRVLHPIEW